MVSVAILRQLVFVVATAIVSLWDGDPDTAGLILHRNARSTGSLLRSVTIQSQTYMTAIETNALKTYEDFMIDIKRFVFEQHSETAVIEGVEGGAAPEWEFDFDFKAGEYLYDDALDFDSPFFLHVRRPDIEVPEKMPFVRNEHRCDSGDTMMSDASYVIAEAFAIFSAFKLRLCWLSLATWLLGIGIVSLIIRILCLPPLWCIFSIISKLRNIDALRELEQENLQLRNEINKLRHSAIIFHTSTTKDGRGETAVRASSPNSEGAVQAAGVTRSELEQVTYKIGGRPLKRRKLLRTLNSDDVEENVEDPKANTMLSMIGVTEVDVGKNGPDIAGKRTKKEGSDCDQLDSSKWEEQIDFVEWNSHEVFNGEQLEEMLSKEDVNNVLDNGQLGEASMDLEDWKPTQTVSGGPDLEPMFRKWDEEEALEDEDLGADMELEDWQPGQVCSDGPDLTLMFLKWDLEEAEWDAYAVLDDEQEGEATLHEILSSDLDVLDGEEEEEDAIFRDMTLLGNSLDFAKTKDDENLHLKIWS